MWNRSVGTSKRVFHALFEGFLDALVTGEDENLLRRGSRANFLHFLQKIQLWTLHWNSLLIHWTSVKKRFRRWDACNFVNETPFKSIFLHLLARFRAWGIGTLTYMGLLVYSQSTWAWRGRSTQSTRPYIGTLHGASTHHQNRQVPYKYKRKGW